MTTSTNSSKTIVPLPLEVLIARKEIQGRIFQAAERLEEEYDSLSLVMLLKGAVVLTSDLMRHLEIPTELEWIDCSSYEGMERGILEIKGSSALDLEGKDVLIVDDIFDSGKTLEGVAEFLLEKKPKSLSSLVLMKKDVSHATDYRPDHVLFEIPDKFVVGYGLDYNEQYRSLPDVCQVVGS